MEEESDTGIARRIQPLISHGTCIKFNQSDPFHIGDKYGGIPLNLLTNCIGWTILMILFIMIRKNVVRTMGFRLATTTIQWTQLFFGGDEQIENDDSDKSLNPNDDQVAAEPKAESEILCKVEGDHVVVDHLHPRRNNPEEDTVSRRSKASFMKNTMIFTLREKKLVDLMGPDAVQYLRFQKYIIIFILLITAVSLGVILPLNFQGTQLGNATDFGHTTLANLNPNDHKDSIILWIHVAIAFLMFPAAIFLMRRFSIGLKMTDTNLKITRTVAIENIPSKVCNIKDIKQHFSEAYPEFRIFGIQVAYNVSKLTEL